MESFVRNSRPVGRGESQGRRVVESPNAVLDGEVALDSQPVTAAAILRFNARIHHEHLPVEGCGEGRRVRTLPTTLGINLVRVKATGAPRRNPQLSL